MYRSQIRICQIRSRCVPRCLIHPFQRAEQIYPFVLLLQRRAQMLGFSKPSVLSLSSPGAPKDQNEVTHSFLTDAQMLPSLSSG